MQSHVTQLVQKGNHIARVGASLPTRFGLYLTCLVVVKVGISCVFTISVMTTSDNSPSCLIKSTYYILSQILHLYLLVDGFFVLRPNQTDEWRFFFFV